MSEVIRAGTTTAAPVLTSARQGHHHGTDRGREQRVRQQVRPTIVEHVHRISYFFP